MIVWDSRQSAISLTAALLILALLLSLVSGAALSQIHWVWPFLIAGGFYYFMMRRYIKRRRALRQPFPETWRDLLRTHVAYYNHLPPDRQSQFERDVQIFLSEQPITGVGVEVTDLLRLLVASSAVMLTFGWPDWEYDNVPEILIYPKRFSEDFDVTCSARHRSVSGMVAPQGAVIFSAPDLYHSFKSKGGYHVGLHEFAHLLDMEAWQADGVPGNLAPRLQRHWVAVIQNELERVRRGESILGDYAGTSLAECFAVAVEYFFTLPSELKEDDPSLYNLLSSFFNQEVK